MNMRNIYLLVPCQYSKPVKEQMLVDKIRMHVGRGKPLLEACDALERELNGGKTVREIADAAHNAATMEAVEQFRTAVHVVSDTWNSWNSYVTAQDWPVQKEVDAYVDANS